MSGASASTARTEAQASEPLVNLRLALRESSQAAIEFIHVRGPTGMEDHQKVLGSRHGDIEQPAVDLIVAAFGTRTQQIDPQQQDDAELQAASAMH